jgi:putative transposase
MRAHLGLGDDGLTETAPVAARVPRFADLLTAPADDPAFGALRRAEGHGRLLGSTDFARALETRLARPILPRKPGRKPMQAALDKSGK